MHYFIIVHSIMIIKYTLFFQQTENVEILMIYEK